MSTDFRVHWSLSEENTPFHFPLRWACPIRESPWCHDLTLLLFVLAPMFLLNSQPLLQLGLECPPKARVLKTWSSDWSFGEMTHIFTKGPGVSLATLRETLKPFLFHSPSLLGCYEMGVSFHRGLLLWHYSFLQSKSTKAHHGTVDDTSEHVSNINLFSLQVDSSQAFDTVR